MSVAVLVYKQTFSWLKYCRIVPRSIETRQRRNLGEVLGRYILKPSEGNARVVHVWCGRPTMDYVIPRPPAGASSPVRAVLMRMFPAWLNEPNRPLPVADHGFPG